ncbi:MAG: class I SAM-dependent methyltransferase [Elusimicrobia bacterium]|nr:class I SAM-dependent methyltransferase [Elusimicrobiota bacterium]
MKKTDSGLKTFWQQKAGHYPLPFERKTAARTARIVRMLENMGVDFNGRSLLDIGCGTGIYGLFLAGRASRVLGVDSSKTMLSKFRAQTGARKIKNAACLNASWQAFRAKHGESRFDIALASMSMAVRSRADVLRMERMAEEHCVYIGWAGKKKNAFMERIFAEHGLAYSSPDGGGKIIKVLKGLGRKPEIRLITDNWSWNGTCKEAMTDVLAHLKLNNARVRRQWLEEFIKTRVHNGRISHKILARKVLIVWRPPGPKNITR